MIWKRHLSLEALNATSLNTMVAHLGIVYTRIGDDTLEAEMPVDARTHQPFGLLHGGASAALGCASRCIWGVPARAGRLRSSTSREGAAAPVG